jgi:eukaryotic-like serine/threonine-protein kinase
MGEVYRAHDTKLGRDVAIKIVHPQFGNDPDHLARFRREAHVLASLNHPHIASIFELAESDAVSFLVMELVEGETLFERLSSGPLHASETFTICIQVAAALEAAHDKGIIHRDLKPANIKITPEGVVKVLDFGLAKALGGPLSGGSLSQPPTGTAQGVILGTAAYMSPEQARGRSVDRRTDIWAFGCVMYEMLAGRMAFEGATVSDTIAAVLERDPDWSTLPAHTPRAVRRLVQRCLEKDAKQRLHDIGDARLEIEQIIQSPNDDVDADVVRRQSHAG